MYVNGVLECRDVISLQITGTRSLYGAPGTTVVRVISKCVIARPGSRFKKNLTTNRRCSSMLSEWSYICDLS